MNRLPSPNILRPCMHFTYLHLERALAVIEEDDPQSEFGLFGDPGHGGEAPEAAEPPLVVLHGHFSPSFSQEEHNKPSISAAIPRVPPPSSPPQTPAAALHALPPHPLRRDPRLPLRMLDGALTLLFPQTEH